MTWIIFGLICTFILGIGLGVVLSAWASRKEEPYYGDLYVCDGKELYADISEEVLKRAVSHKTIRLKIRIINSSYNGN